MAKGTKGIASIVTELTEPLGKTPLPPVESDTESDYSSSDVTEDEDGTELTPALDAAILRTLTKIKNKQGVYGTDNVLAAELKEAELRAEKLGLKAGVSKPKPKAFTLADHHRATLLSTSDPTVANPSTTHAYAESDGPLTHVQSERVLRAEALSAFQNFGAEVDEEDEDVLVKRQKDEEEEEGEEEEYRKFLLEMGGGEEEVRKVLGLGGEGGDADADDESDESDGSEEESVAIDAKAESKVKVEKPGKGEIVTRRKEQKVKSDDDFLMNYILNRGWIDRTEEHVPTYDEIVGPEKTAQPSEVRAHVQAGPSSHPWGEIDEEDEFDEKADEFETAYNFRFEEPDAANISSHPRIIPELVRRPDDARKTKRAARAERKAAEKAVKEEEIRREKGKKRREMDKLKQEIGEEGLDWTELERVLEGDYEEDEWERIVGGMLSRRENGDIEEEDDEEKPSWDDDLGDEAYDMDEGDDVELHLPYTNGAEENNADQPLNMDADFLEDPAKKKSKKNKKGKGKAAPETETAVDDGLTVLEKANKVKEAMEEYKKLDYEDMIGDLPTRFKYTPSAPVNFGLTPIEILLATDSELNQLVSVKHIAPYKSGGLGFAGKGLGKRVRELKDELAKRKWGEEGNVREKKVVERTQGAEKPKPKTKRLGPKQRLRKLAAEKDKKGEEHAEPVGGGGEKRVREEEVGPGGEDGEGKKKRRKKKKGVEGVQV
ncbi:protein KRI1, partial [Tremellales sp. Uapishka_1]